jgi:hypothetical protein
MLKEKKEEIHCTRELLNVHLLLSAEENQGAPWFLPTPAGILYEKKYTVSSFARRPPEGAQEEPIRKYHGKSGIK